VESEPDGDPPQITRRHLQRLEALCPRRLVAERARTRESQLNRGGNVRFEVAHRIEADVRLAHSAMRAPRRGDFPLATELYPEQQRVHAAAGEGYLALFGDTEARTTDAVDPWATELGDPVVRLSGSVGVALDINDGRRELRLLRVGRRDGDPLLDTVDVWFSVLRAGDWAGDDLRVVAADLLSLEMVEHDVDTAAELPKATAWFEERRRRVDSIAANPLPREGADCAGCPVVAGCAVHRVR
jgi:hypothetical protein